jgi:SAM-dependent methyltransferase
LLSVGFFREMESQGKVDAVAFAQTHALSEPILKMLCDYLYGVRILKKSGTAYTLDRKGKLALETGYGWFQATYGYKDVYYDLEALLRKDKEYGKQTLRDPALIAAGSGKMEKALYYPLVIDMLRGTRFRHVLDIGCGDCGFLIELCKSNPLLKGYGLDLSPEALSVGQEEIARAGMKDRILVACQDLTAMKKPPDTWAHVDAATCFFVLHEVLYPGPDMLIGFLRSYQKIFPGAPLIVVEVIRASLEKTRKSSGMGAAYYLQHDLTHQKLAGRDEWLGYFRAAGFRNIEERQLKFAKSSIFTLQ